MKNLKFDYTGGKIKDKEIANIANGLEEYRDHLCAVAEKGDFFQPEASLCLPSDNLSSQRIENMVMRFPSRLLKYIVVVGIGGSNLGTAALYTALMGTQDAFDPTRLPKLLFLDTTSTDKMSEILHLLNHNARNRGEFLINIISKSGDTVETIANFEILYKELTKIFGDITSRIIVTTDKGLKLWRCAEKLDFPRLYIPRQIGGRYSVFSAVGLFPLSLVDIDTRSLLLGAETMREMCLSSNTLENPAIMSAALLYIHYQKNITIHNNFLFDPRLELVGKWYCQLIAESLGKKHDTDGNIVRAGITPIISIGLTDLHSMAQLYLGGPQDKFTTFLSVRDEGKDINVPEIPLLEGLITGISGHSLEFITDAIKQGVQATYKNLNLPFMSIVMPEISPYYLGQYLQFEMIKTMYLAKLLRVNAFDQPAVEQYKIATRKILEQ
ncbi:hypothetical protein KJ973_02395 [Patescibacteria group bacterium]|nr:hypothetical protein [Patescibacteria group bacterium]MBU1246428.1 hypothetical protein [Patescibacteria group bacterium]MBU1519516.1 hypothetical protein [Patescibacteria group bacterium]MBU1730026.1 hypothetical protein [Patescibacteria group bacterium]MBU1956235.1 hypothetical protein [Patescibacteria group bacterium]